MASTNCRTSSIKILCLLTQDLVNFCKSSNAITGAVALNLKIKLC